MARSPPAARAAGCRRPRNGTGEQACTDAPRPHRRPSGSRDPPTTTCNEAVQWPHTGDKWPVRRRFCLGQRADVAHHTKWEPESVYSQRGICFRGCGCCFTRASPLLQKSETLYRKEPGSKSSTDAHRTCEQVSLSSFNFSRGENESVRRESHLSLRRESHVTRTRHVGTIHRSVNV